MENVKQNLTFAERVTAGAALGLMLAMILVPALAPALAQL